MTENEIAQVEWLAVEKAMKAAPPSDGDNTDGQFCSKCGTQIAKSAKFCSGCGVEHKEDMTDVLKNAGVSEEVLKSVDEIRKANEEMRETIAAMKKDSLKGEFVAKVEELTYIGKSEDLVDRLLVLNDKAPELVDPTLAEWKEKNEILAKSAAFQEIGEPGNELEGNESATEQYMAKVDEVVRKAVEAGKPNDAETMDAAMAQVSREDPGLAAAYQNETVYGGR